MAFIDVVDWQPQSNDIFAWRFPNENLSTATQLIVRESQEAVFFSKGMQKSRTPAKSGFRRLTER